MRKLLALVALAVLVSIAGGPSHVYGQSTVTDRIDGVSTALSMKAPVRVATTANITLSGLQTIDGVVLATGDRVLVKNQTTVSENGIRVANTSTWTRAKDFDGNTDAVQGTMVPVAAGSTQSGYIYRLTTANPVVIGTSSLTFVQALVGSGADVSFQQATAGSGATTLSRDIQGKARELVSADDYVTNAAPGTTDMTTGITNAMRSLRMTTLPTSTYRINSAVEIRGGEGLTGPGPGADFRGFTPSTSTGTGFYTQLATLVDYPRVRGIGLTNASTATTGFDLSTARNGVFDDLYSAGYATEAFKFGKTTALVGNYYNNFNNFTAANCGVGIQIGKVGDGANANNIGWGRITNCTTGVKMNSTQGTNVGPLVMSTVTNAFNLTQGSGNRIVAYLEAATNLGTIASDFFDNSIEVLIDGGTAVAFSDSSGTNNKMRVFPNPLPSLEYPGRQEDRTGWTWTAATKSIYTLELQAEGICNVRLQSTGIITSVGGGSESAELVITRVDNGTAAVSAARAAVRSGSGGAFTSTVSGGVVTLKISGDAGNSAVFYVKLTAECVTTNGSGVVQRVLLNRLP